MTSQLAPQSPSRPVPARRPPDERGRCAAVRHHRILDTPAEEAFDRIAVLAARLLEMPMAAVVVVAEGRAWFKAAHGLRGLSGSDRGPGLCDAAVPGSGTLVIPDTLLDPVAVTHPLVTGPSGVRFYAGAPITTADGHHLGTLVVLDTRPRTITANDTATLTDLAGMVMDELDLRRSALDRRDAAPGGTGSAVR